MQHQIIKVLTFPREARTHAHTPRPRDRREMELNEHGFLEELLALRVDTSGSIPTPMNEFFSNGWTCGYFEQNPAMVFPNSYCEGFSPQLEQNVDTSYTLNEVYYPFGNAFSASQLTDSSLNTLDTPPFPIQEDYPFSIMEEELGILGDEIHNLEVQASCKAEPIQSPDQVPVMNIGNCLEAKNPAKKLQGQPSKNLMAERRRRKRLNDRLSMLRSIVPKISKMDRTSILGDTIDYMKELLEKINSLQQEIEGSSNITGIFKNVKPNEVLVRNSPKFDVERRNEDTRIEICCAGKPGLLLSTVNTLEALGLEIQQCVISCFNDFAMQASCSEDMDQGTLLSSEDIKQTLFRNAGYGGRCL